MDMLKYQVFPS